MNPELGKKYYTCGLDIFTIVVEPVVATFVYEGYFELDHNSPNCDIPHHFYRFAFYGQEHLKVNVPSLQMIKKNYLTFPQLMEALPLLASDALEFNGAAEREVNG